MKKRRYFAGGGVPTTGRTNNPYGNFIGNQPFPPPVQYPFPSSDGGGVGPPPSTSNTTVNVNGQEVSSEESENPFEANNQEGPLNFRRGGKVKAKKSRGDGIAQRGKTRGRFVR